MKYKQLVIGALFGSLITGAGAAVASESTAITAFLKDAVVFKFNGVEKKLDNGYSVLSYKNSTYVPARFVAEQLGAKVLWDNAAQTILIDSPSAITTPSVPETKPVQQPKPEIATPVTPTADWDKYDAEWSNTDITVKLDFISAAKANVELKSTTKTEFNGLKFAADFTAISGSGEASLNGQNYSISFSPTDGKLLITIVNKTTRHVYTGILSGTGLLPITSPDSGSPLPDTGSFSGNLSDYQGKWKREKQTLTLSFSGNTAKVVYDNEDPNGVSDFTTEIQISSTGGGNTEFTVDGSKKLVQLTLGNKQLIFAVVDITTGLYSNEIYTVKE